MHLFLLSLLSLMTLVDATNPLSVPGLGIGGFLLSLLSLTALVDATNPLRVPGLGFGGIADPHVHYWPQDGNFYLYTTHDMSPNSTGFLNDDWRIFKSSDLLEWSLVSTLYPNQTSARPQDYHTCWATDAAEKDGLYYFYLSLGNSQIGVVRSPTPYGPWEDVLQAPLINISYGTQLKTEARDPGVFQDTDGSYYLVFGTFNYYIARLGPDMMHLEAPQPVNITTADGGPPTSQNGVGILDDKPFLHRKGGTYYFSFGGFYAQSTTSPYGPFTQFAPTWVDPTLIAPEFNLDIPHGPCWCQNVNYNDRHGSFFSAHGQDYWSSNDRSHSVDKANTNAYRDTILTYVHYLANGTIAPVVINSTGVGSYRVEEGVEAENFFSLQGPGGKWQGGGGGEWIFAMGGLHANSTLLYPHVRGDFRGVTGVGVMASSSSSLLEGGGKGGGVMQGPGKSARILVALSTPHLSGKNERGWMRGRAEIDVSRVVEGGSGGWEALQGGWVQWESGNYSGSGGGWGGENEGMEGDALITLTVEGDNSNIVLIDRLWLVR